MVSARRVAALFLVFVVLLVPLAAQARDEGPCPDDPTASKDCNPEAPPFYVVINRSFEDLDRPGTGCQPIILKHPECEDCCDEKDTDCVDASDDLEENVCPMLASMVEWETDDQTEIVYEMCCDCSENDDGAWKFKMRLLYEDGTCPVDDKNPDCYKGLPPGTGIDLPTPVLVAGLALIGAALLATGAVVRRRTPVGAR